MTTLPARLALVSTTPEHCPNRPCLFHGKVPDGAVWVGRQAPGRPRSPYANPYKVGDGHFTLTESRDLFRANRLPLLDCTPLRGLDLVCSCSLDAQWCHATDLIEKANQ